MNRTLLTLLLILPLTACQTLRPGPSTHASPIAGTSSALVGDFDNHEQVWAAAEQGANALAPPHVVVTIEPTGRDGWSIWHVRLDAATPLDASWAMQHIDADAGALELRPHRPITQTPATGRQFDPAQWVSLEACALRGTVTPAGLRAAVDVAACTALAPGIGPQTALLPLAVEHEGEWLHVRLYADQARGATARADARKIATFAGWAAVNGAGQNAMADSSDWHMDRTLRIGTEGGRVALHWRDGSASGYSLMLERLTYREGNVPVLKLSLIEDASGRVLAYAWTNPEATRIGINLGWVQVGLDRAGAPATR
jgi:hypothetical protein